MSRGAKIAIGIGVLALVVYLLLASPYNTLVALDENVGPRPRPTWRSPSSAAWI